MGKNKLLWRDEKISMNESRTIVAVERSLRDACKSFVFEQLTLDDAIGKLTNGLNSFVNQGAITEFMVKPLSFNEQCLEADVWLKLPENDTMFQLNMVVKDD